MRCRRQRYPLARHHRYVSGMSVEKASSRLPAGKSGETRHLDARTGQCNGITGWALCNIQSDSALQQACEDNVRFDANWGDKMKTLQLNAMSTSSGCTDQ